MSCLRSFVGSRWYITVERRHHKAEISQTIRMMSKTEKMQSPPKNQHSLHELQGYFDFLHLLLAISLPFFSLLCFIQIGPQNVVPKRTLLWGHLQNIQFTWINKRRRNVYFNGCRFFSSHTLAAFHFSYQLFGFLGWILHFPHTDRSESFDGKWNLISCAKD